MSTIGTGTTVTFQSGLFAEIIELEWSGITRAVYETSNFGTTGGMTYAPGSLYDSGEISVRYAFDPEIDPTTAIAAASETVTVTFADAAPASTMAASGTMRDLTISVPLEDRVTANAVIKLSGSITHG
tara:strand:- start:5558 stop:5941 length:384 start_codon:yes stop_codon:yes gene_type:complete